MTKRKNDCSICEAPPSMIRWRNITLIDYIIRACLPDFIIARSKSAGPGSSGCTSLPVIINM